MKSSRCPECFWGLYDGTWCQNKDCRNYWKEIKAPVMLTNEEASRKIKEKENDKTDTPRTT